MELQYGNATCFVPVDIIKPEIELTTVNCTVFLHILYIIFPKLMEIL